MSVDLFVLLCWLWSIVIVLFLAAIGRTYFFRDMLRHEEPVAELPLLTIIIPVRNEEHNIGICLDGVVSLDYPTQLLQVIVVNDHSSDATRELVEGYCQQHHHIELLDAAALPAGWMGKAHGCWLGATQARGEWLLFIDADTYVKPRLLRAVVGFVQRRATDLLSLIPFQILHSWQERIWLPGLFLGIAASVNFRRVNNPDDPYSLANGQFLMFRRAAYLQLGGHQAIRHELSDDLALAALAKQHRLKFYCLFGDEHIATRMYRSLSEIWRGFAKNLAEIMFVAGWRAVAWQVFKSAGVALGALILPLWWGLGYAYAVTPVTLLLTILSGTLLITFLATARELHLPWYYAITFPLGLLLHAVLLIYSYQSKRNGRREWKGRHYHF